MELAHVYAENGYNLFLTARREEDLKELKKTIEKKLKVSVGYYPLDLSGPGSAEVLHAKTKELNINFEIIINNAGFGIYGEFIDSDIAQNEMMLNLNILSLTKICKLFGEDLVRQGYGQIVNIASTAAFQPVPYLAAYAASKSYVLHFSEALAYELKPKNIFVTAICPGATASEFGQVAGFGEGENQSNMPSSRDLAGFTFKEVKKKKVMSIHGTKNSFMTFSQRFVPRKLVTRITAGIIKSD
ncbi:MAG: SDR family NAD(P)-dependent oxidoreductase [Bacteroidales bacterium]|nr:SDR family NAD(P)-dependent oxidoreductase [Bacteroidales bacterium]